MYYRVKKFSQQNLNMDVLDNDDNLALLKSRTNIDCVGLGPRSFSNPIFIESQQINCISQGGVLRNTDIIKE
jgi:hypothetical protein